MIFNNRVAVVTGGGGGIGGALTRLFTENGVAVAVVDCSIESAEKIASEVRAKGGKAQAFRMDIANENDVLKGKEDILKTFGKVDILVNNAAVVTHLNHQQHAFGETPKEEWKRILDTNLYGTFHVTHAFLPVLLKNGYGRIINVASIAGEVGLPGFADYAATKGAIILFSKTLAMEYAKKNITVNCISPGMVSNRDNTVFPNTGTWIGRSGKREEMASLIAFLASDDSGFITGADYTIDGGRTVGPHSWLPEFN